MLVDTHCHLTDEKFAEDVDAVIERARRAGVTRMLTLGTDVESSRNAIALAEKYAEVYAAVGIHPESVRDAKVSDLDTLRELAKHKKVVAIGETGLDYYWDQTAAALQQDWFEKQLALAAELDLPVSIHDREAHDAVRETLVKAKKRWSHLRGVLHSFSGDMILAQTALELDFKISFAGPLTFLNAKQPPALARRIDSEQLLIETDSPYLSPHPLRGKRNEPANVQYVAKRLAELKEMGFEETCRLMSRNAQALFKW